MKVKAYDKCVNCYQDFADHNYVPDSIDEYLCPHPVQESGYGYFHGGDPRNFHPDSECCSEEEIANHQRACRLWDEAERRGETPTPEACPSGWIFDEYGNAVAHVLRSPYGIGTYTVEHQTCFEAIDAEDSEYED